MNDTIKWGILGVGNIARKFARDLVQVPGASLIAVASCSQERAADMAREFGIPRHYANYEGLAADPEVEVIYVATRNHAHAENMRLALAHDKAVLCEKPFAINASQARAVIDLARSRRVFVMEAMWTRFFPAIVRLRELLAQGAIGQVKILSADFGVPGNLDPAGRLMNPQLGGGALLDVGVYIVSLASMIFGRPESVSGIASIAPTGVDDACAITLRFGADRLASLLASVSTSLSKKAVVYGTEGDIVVECPLWKPRALTLTRQGKEPETIHLPYDCGGYRFEILEVMECLRAGKLESAIMPLDETLAILETMDTLRASWGVKYPME